MDSTDKTSCIILVELLRAHGVENVVISPGSRNAPIIVALAACDDIKKTVVIDERSAGFIALGIASVTEKPVAIVCTSGTAVLNYAPAIAEAYYRNIPLVVISADRPIEWIDQDDSQTLRQYEALSHYVKCSYDIPVKCDNNTEKWYINRIINDALLSAKSQRKAPVHINIRLDDPLGNYCSIQKHPLRLINKIEPDTYLPQNDIADLSRRINNSSKVLIVAGFLPPNSMLNYALSQIAKHTNIVVMCESIANLHSTDFISSIDRTLSVMNDFEKEQMCPDIVVTLGGALVSRFIKQYLRGQHIAEHWHIGVTDNTIDCFQSLTTRINIAPEYFFNQLADTLIAKKSNYACEWHAIAKHAKSLHNEYLKIIGWSDLKAFSIIMQNIPSTWNLQLSNGTSIRYAQLFSSEQIRRSDCNRGVSGIDGCTSTAIGASIGYNGTTLLISGDMSAQYDIGAFACSSIPSNFKMVVLCNGGGGIFRFIKSTSHLKELEEYFTVNQPFPLCQIATGYGFSYYEAASEHDLENTLPSFITETSRPAILAIYTPAKESAEILRQYFSRHNIINKI